MRPSLFRHLSTAQAEMYYFQVSILLLATTISASQVVLSSSQPATGNIAYTLPTERTFLLNVPEAYEHGEAHPLVLSFHGGEFAIPSYKIM